MISVHTHSQSMLTTESWKWVVRRLIGKYSGPDAVRDSLVRGFQALGVEFILDPKQPAKVVVVLSGTEALGQAIKHKQSGRIETLMAGPNVTGHPFDANRIMLDAAIDVILVPSKWVADLWISEAPELIKKIKIWPSGVAESKASTRSGKPVIYDKLGDPSLLTHLRQVLESSAHVFTYGSFNHNEYLSALSDAPYLIYLSKSESQGLALQEAWAHDVPTLVNKSTAWKSGELAWEAPRINCPYLTPELGAVFETYEEIPTMVAQVSKLHPKLYCDEHLSDRASAQMLLKLI